MFFSPHRPVPVSRVLLLKTLISILIFTTIVTASRPHAHYDPPIPLQFSSCTQRQITTLTSELNLIRHLSASISENWENNRDSPHIRDTYNYFYTAGDSGPLYGYESTEVKRGLRRVLERMGKIQIVGLEEMGKEAGGQGEGYIRGKKYRDGLRIICKPRREADCGNSVGEGVEAFVSNGPTVRVGPELETLVVKRAVSEGMKGKRWRLGTTEVKDKASRRNRWKWLLTNGNDVQLCPLFWENKSLDVPHPLEALREIPVGDFVDYRLLTLMHELTHTHLLTGDLFLSASHENRLSLGLLDHGYGLRHPRTTETGDSSLLPRTYGERIVRNYDDSGKVLTRELKPVPYITELTRREAWANADTFVYFVFVAWQGEGASSSTTGTHGARGGGTGGRSSRRRKSRIERLEEIIRTSKHGIAIGAQRVLQRTGKGSPGTGLTALAPGENLARGCSKGREPVLEILGGSNRGRRELRRIWCRRKRIW